MSLNLHLRVRLFEKRVSVEVHQTPSGIIPLDVQARLDDQPGERNREYRARYVNWVRKAIVDPEDHLRRIDLYCEHYLHEWTLE